MLVLLIKVLPWLIFLGGLVLAGYRVWTTASEEESGGRVYRDSEKPKAKKLSLALPVVLVLLGLLSGIAFSTATEVAPTSVAVVENTWNGNFYQLEGGAHVWPFEPTLAPLMTKVYTYDLRRQIIEIGETPAGAAKPAAGVSTTQAFGVASSSDSPGQPVIFFRARGWAFVNREMVITLHRRYGADYLNSWVEQQWVTTLKSIQGRHAYDYIKSNRVAFEDEVEKALQAQLTVDDQKLVNVSQLAVVDYDYEDKINKFLQGVAEQEFARQVAEQQAQVNQKKQDAEKIAADTIFIVTKRTAEANKEKQIAEADGQAQAITSVANAQAEANRKINASLTELLVQYNLAKQWNGAPPMFYSGQGSPMNFLIQTPSMTTAPITGTVPVTAAVPTK